MGKIVFKVLYTYELIANEEICNEELATSSHSTRYQRGNGICNFMCRTEFCGDFSHLPSCIQGRDECDLECCKRACDKFDWCTHFTWFDSGECRLYDYCTTLVDGHGGHGTHYVSTYRKVYRSDMNHAEASMICSAEG